MFKFSTNITFWWPVKVIEPHPDDAGKFIEHEFKAKFEMLPPDEGKASAKVRQAIVGKITPELSDEEIETIQAELDEHDLTLLLRTLRGWDKILDADGKPINFSEANFRLLYGYRHIRNAFVRAYIDALSEDKARLGN